LPSLSSEVEIKAKYPILNSNYLKEKHLALGKQNVKLHDFRQKLLLVRNSARVLYVGREGPD